MVSGTADGCGRRFGGGVRRRVGGAVRGCLGRRLLRPLLVEVDAPLALVVLLELELRAESSARAALEAGHGLLGTARAGLLAALARVLERRHQLLHDRRRQVLARLLLPDHESAPGVVL